MLLFLASSRAAHISNEVPAPHVLCGDDGDNDDRHCPTSAGRRVAAAAFGPLPRHRRQALLLAERVRPAWPLATAAADGSRESAGRTRPKQLQHSNQNKNTARPRRWEMIRRDVQSRLLSGARRAARGHGRGLFVRDRQPPGCPGRRARAAEPKSITSRA
jgi:hypothetical protein